MESGTTAMSTMGTSRGRTAAAGSPEAKSIARDNTASILGRRTLVADDIIWPQIEDYHGLYLIIMCLVLRLMSIERPVRRLDFRVSSTPPRTSSRSWAPSGSSPVGRGRGEPCGGYHGNPIIILEVSQTARAPLEAFWGRLRDAGLCGGVAENLEERINESGELFIRFDKQAAVAGRLPFVGRRCRPCPRPGARHR